MRVVAGDGADAGARAGARRAGRRPAERGRLRFEQLVPAEDDAREGHRPARRDAASWGRGSSSSRRSTAASRSWPGCARGRASTRRGSRRTRSRRSTPYFHPIAGGPDGTGLAVRAPGPGRRGLLGAPAPARHRARRGRAALRRRPGHRRARQGDRAPRRRAARARLQLRAPGAGGGAHERGPSSPAWRRPHPLVDGPARALPGRRLHAALHAAPSTRCWRPSGPTLDNFGAYLDPALTPDDFLDWLGGWVGVALDETWPIERRRAFVAQAADLYRLRGTRAGLAAHVQIFTGGEVGDRGQRRRDLVADERRRLPRLAGLSRARARPRRSGVCRPGPPGSARRQRECGRPAALAPRTLRPRLGRPSWAALSVFATLSDPRRHAHILQDHGRAFLGDHHGRRVGVAGGDGGHDRGVDHAQALEPLHPQPRIDHRRRVDAHLAGADGMEDRRGDVAGGAREILVARRSQARGGTPAAYTSAAPASRRCAASRGRFGGDAPVVLGREIVRPDVGMRGRIGRGDAAPSRGSSGAGWRRSP